MLLYRFLTFLLAPFIILYALRNPKLKVGLSERLGKFNSQMLQAFQDSRKGRLIWLHGVSVGEIKLILAILPHLRESLRDFDFLLTTTTENGMRVLRENEQMENVFVSYFPLGDIPFAINRFLQTFKPKMFISAEAEAWPNLLHSLKRSKAKTILVNARLFLEKKSALMKKIYAFSYRNFDKILCQHEKAKSAFSSLNIPEEKLFVTGNIKHQSTLDPWTPAMIAELREKLGWKKSLVITAGSTHRADEEVILGAFDRIKVKNERAVLALVPRHPERAKEVLAFARSMFFKAQRYSYFNEVFRPLSVLIVDEMGALPNFYQIADIVILGGTFDRNVGGHNIIEPVSLKKPIVIGPYVDSIRNEVETLRKDALIIEVGDEEGLERALGKLLESESERKRLGQSAYDALIGKSKPIEETVAKIVNEALS